MLSVHVSLQGPSFAVASNFRFVSAEFFTGGWVGLFRQLSREGGYDGLHSGWLCTVALELMQIDVPW
jgi:hypothetical protein